MKQTPLALELQITQNISASPFTWFTWPRCGRNSGFGHVRHRTRLDGCQDCGWLSVRSPHLEHRWRRQYRLGSQLVRASFRTSQLVRVRPPRLGLRSERRGDCRRMDSDDLVERPARTRRYQDPAAWLLESLHQHDDAAGTAPHHAGGPSLWPDPAFNSAKRPDWNNVYYHRADTQGIGFNRSSTGSDAVSQYSSPLREQFDHMDTCPQEFLLWFHHVPWDHRLQSGHTLWESCNIATIWASLLWKRCKACGRTCRPGLIPAARARQPAAGTAV